jgi:hypothetical protein
MVRVRDGVEEPIPTLPLARMEKREVVAKDDEVVDAISKSLPV